MSEKVFDNSAGNGDPGRQSEVVEVLWRYVDRLNAGEKLDDSTIRSEEPELADDLIRELKTFRELGSDESHDTPPLGTLGDYTLRRQIGRGGMGVVYDAWENSMDRQVALKVLPPGVAADERALQRFVREAKTAGQLNHVNVVSVYSTGVKEGTPWYAMEYVDGETLAQVLGRWKGAESETETVFGRKDSLAYYSNLAGACADLADGLQHAHSKGVVHRDIKPSNIILEGDGRLRILDFGLARLEGQESLTLSGDFVGTPAYMSPEQARRRKVAVDHRTDVYSLGATLYEFLTHQQPFRGRDHADTLSQIIERDPRPLRQLNPKVPANLEMVVLKCLRKDAADRYGTAEALGQDLRRFVRGDAVEAQAQSVWEKAARRLRRQWKVAIAALALLTVVSAALVVGTVVMARARDQARYDLYVSNMRLAMEDWESGNFSRLLRLLETHAPEPSESDLRGWEWYYLEGLCGQEVLNFEGHSNTVYSVAWSPDGGTLASGGPDGTVRLWRSSSDSRRESVVTAFELGASVRAVAWSPDGTQLVAAGENGRIKTWRIHTGDEFAFDAQQIVSCLAASRDFGRFASGDLDGRVRIWDARTGELQTELPVSEDPTIIDSEVLSLAWSPDGKWLAAGIRERDLGPILLWDTGTWVTSRRLPGHRRPALSLAWSPDGRRLASGSLRHNVKIWNADTWDEDATLVGHNGAVRSVAWRGDGSWLASGASDGTVKIWNSSTHEEIRTLRGHSGKVLSVAWSPDGELLAAGASDGMVKVWDASREQNAWTLPGTSYSAWSSDGAWLALYNRADRRDSKSTISVVDDSTGIEVSKLTVDGNEWCRCHAFSPNGRLLATAWGDGRLRIWNWERREEVVTVEAHPGQARSVAWRPHDGGWVATGGRGGAKVWDSATGREIRAFAVGGTVGSVAWSPCGEHLAAMSWCQLVQVWDVPGGRKAASLRLHPPPAQSPNGRYSISWSPEGERLACGSSEGMLVVLDALTGRELHRVQGHTSNIRSVAWSPDGRRLATGSNDHSLKIWDAESCEELITLRGHEGNVLGVAWHPDGKRLLSSSPFCSKIWMAPGYGSTQSGR